MGRRSRSRSRSRSQDRKGKTNRSSSTSVRGSSSGGGGGGSSSSKRRGSGRSDKDTASNSVKDVGDRRGSSRSGGGGGKGGGNRDSRSRSVDRKGDSSSRRHDGRDRDRDRERDTRDRDRLYHPRDARSRRNGWDGDGRDERDRKRSRGSGRRDDDGNRDKGSRGERGRETPDDMWKRKLRDEDKQLKELDLDELMVDEEEEERRLEEQRRERREKLEALQQRKKDEEQARREAAEAALAAAAPAASATNDAGDTINDEALHPGDRQSPPPRSSSNGDPAVEKATSMLSNSVINSVVDCEEDDDAGPIKITKEAAGPEDGSNVGGTLEEEDGNDDESGARNDALIPGEGRGNRKAAIGSGGVGAGGRGGLSSSELRAKQGKEDRPVFDMFSASSPSAAAAGAGPGGKMGGKGGGHGMSYLGDDGGGDQGNWTDVEGYYKTRVGEVIGGRYTVLGSVGQGVFSTVLKCLDTRARWLREASHSLVLLEKGLRWQGGDVAGPAAVGGASEVALKMIRNNDTMRKAAQKEISLLKELAEHDPTNRKHCIRLLCSLEHKQHVVMVFEAMQMNLRETLKKFGRKTGINIHAVQKYGKQLMAALKHMASRNLVHADIKPDNILVDQGFGSLKLADFGSAFRESDPDNDPTPYLVSRWYRAPEIVMGLEYDKAIDLWSVAVTLFELYKGSPILPGVNNNEMLKRMMEFKGPVPTRMIKSHMRAFETMGGIRPHFTEGGQFMQQEPDPVTGQATVRLVTVTAPSRPIKGDIMRSKGAQDKKDTVVDLADFLDKCMSLDPRQRMSLEQCSAHSFLRRM